MKKKTQNNNRHLMLLLFFAVATLIIVNVLANKEQDQLGRLEPLSEKNKIIIVNNKTSLSPHG